MGAKERMGGIPSSIQFNEAGQQLLAKVQAQPSRVGECSFVDEPCPRPELAPFCGGMVAILRALRDVPAFVVFSTFDRIRRVPPQPGEQMRLFPEYQWQQGNGRFREKQRWWVACYYCKIGRDWAIGNEKQIGAEQIRVEVVRRKAGCKRKTYSEEWDFCMNGY